MAGHAQQIRDSRAPAANLPSVGTSGNGTPTINIAPPNAGVSHNKFQSYDVDAKGVILNNSTAAGQSRIGGAVGANPNLLKTGPASTILNEVTGTAASTLKGVTEVFGTRADVILANPNGITCTGCSFINTGRASLVTATPTVTGSTIEFTVSKGIANVSGLSNSGGSLDVVGRHVIVGTGGVDAQGALLISGGSQYFNQTTQQVRAAPITTTRQTPYAVDASSYGAMTAGQIRIHGNEAGLGVVTYGDITARGAPGTVNPTAGNVTISSLDNLYYINAYGAGSAKITATGGAYQYGDVIFGQNISIGAGDYYLARDKKVQAGGDVDLTTDRTATVYGEISGRNISIKTGGNFNNLGFVMADANLTITSGDALYNQREKLSEYTVTYDAGMLAYANLAKSWVKYGGWYTEVANYWMSLYEKRTLINEDVAKGGTITGTTVNLGATTDITNIGAVVASTGDLSLSAGRNVASLYILLNKKTDGGTGLHKEFYPTQILAGGNLSLKAGGSFSNQASTLAAYGHVNIDVKGWVTNYLTADKYVTENRNTAGTLAGSGTSTTSSSSTSNWWGLTDTVKLDTTTSWSTTTWIDKYRKDENLVLSPGLIASLTGDLNLKAGNYYAIGSDLSAGRNLNLKVANYVGLEQVADTVRKYSDTATWSATTSTSKTTQTETLDLSAWGWGRYSWQYQWATGGTSTSGYARNIQDVTTTIVAASDIIGRNVTIEAGTFNAPGAKIYAEAGLSLKTTGRLDLAPGLPKDTAAIDQITQYNGWDNVVADNKPVEVKFRELGLDPVAKIRGDAALTAAYRDYLSTQDDMRAVLALRYSTAPQLRATARKVGVQSWTWKQSEQGVWYVDAASIVQGQSTFAKALGADFEARKTAAADTDLMQALAWRFGIDEGKTKLATAANIILYAGADLTVASASDIGLTGGVVLTARNNIRLEAGNDIILIGVNTPGVIGTQANARLYGGGNYNYQSTLSRASVVAGNDLTLVARRDIWNVGSTLTAGGNLIATAEGEIHNHAMRTYFVQSAASGCQNWACGRGDGVMYNPAEMMAGAGLVLTAKGDVVNQASVISAAGSILIASERDVINSAIKDKYLSNYLHIEDRPWWMFGACRTCIHIEEYTGAVQGGDISTLLGDITLQAGRDVRNIGSRLTAGGTIRLAAKQDILLDAETQEVNNASKQKGFSGWFSYGSQKTSWNNFTTSLSQLEGGAIEATAKRNLTGIGASLLAQTDMALSADGTLTFDAEQNQKYLINSGWSFGASFKGLDLIKTLATSGGKDAFKQYINSNPMLAAVATLANSKGKWDNINGGIALGIASARTFGAATNVKLSDGSYLGTGKDGLIGALAQQFNPFPSYDAVAKGCTTAPTDCMMALGVSFRYSAWESQKSWTESHISKLVAGRDLTVGAGNDIALVGGTVISAANDLSLVAGRDLVISALADTATSKSSNWGASLGFSQSGITVGGNYFTSKSATLLYTRGGEQCKIHQRIECRWYKLGLETIRGGSTRTSR